MGITTRTRWGGADLSDDEELWIAQIVIKNFVYLWGMESELGAFFGLDKVPGWLLLELGVHKVNGIGVRADTEFYTALSVVPMGWSWACFFAQAAHAEAVQQSVSLRPDEIMAARRPPPSLDSTDGLVLPYSDNLAI